MRHPLVVIVVVALGAAPVWAARGGHPARAHAAASSKGRSVASRARAAAPGGPSSRLASRLGRSSGPSVARPQPVARSAARSQITRVAQKARNTFEIGSALAMYSSPILLVGAIVAAVPSTLRGDWLHAVGMAGAGTMVAFAGVVAVLGAYVKVVRPRNERRALAALPGASGGQ